MLIYFLIIVVVVALIASIFMNFAPFFYTSLSTEHLLKIIAWSPDKPLEHLPALVLSAAASIAILTYLQGKKKSKSESFFRQASHELDDAFSLLEKRNNDRVIWVRAARSLLQAKKIAQKIELEEIQHEYRLYEQRVRNNLYLALRFYNPSTKHHEVLPPQFFYGISDWENSSKKLDEVAVEVSPPIEVYRSVIDKLPPQPHLYPLSMESMCAIFDFLNYPSNYEDPLKKVKVWSANYDFGYNEKAGAERYITHRQTK